MSAAPQTIASNSIYTTVLRERIARLGRLRSELEHDKSYIRKLRAYYRDHLAQMIEDWGITIDPRNVRKHTPVIMPFLLDPRQREWIDFTLTNWRDGEYGLTVKSRDVGISWLLVALSISICECFENVGIGWGSYKKEKVDRFGDLGSLFEKGRQYLEAQPIELRAGHDPRSNSFERRLLFPQTGSYILGEIGDEIGRGGRTAMTFVDEAAYLEHDYMVDAALSKTTDCRQDVSSVHGMNNTFAQRAHQAGVRRFNFHWRENPRMTDADYEKFLETWGPVITAQELDMNFQASVEHVLIPASWVNSAVDAHLKLKQKVSGELLVALDIADQGIDKNAICVRHGILVEHVESWSGKGSDTYATAERAFMVCDTHRARRMIYDADGVGAHIRGDARKINELRRKENAPPILIQAFRGSGEVMSPEREMVEGRKNKDFFANWKAQAGWWLRMLFQNTDRAVSGQPFDPTKIIAIDGSIPEKARLLIELSQPTYSQNNVGKLLIDKQPEGKPSPDLYDSVMMAFAPAPLRLRILDSALGVHD